MDKQLSPEWLTAAMRRAGYAVTVTGVQVAGSKTSATSQVYRLLLRYHQTTGAPRHLFLKLTRPSQPWMYQEVQFYRDVLPLMQKRYGTLPCFVHAYDTGFDGVHAHLLLEDLHESHFGIRDGRPNRAHFTTAVDGFAVLHAYWWEHPDLGERVGVRMNAGDIDAAIRTTQARLVEFLRFAEAHNVDLTPRQRRMLNAVATQWPDRRRARLLAGQGLTLVHRDPHPFNFMYAKTSADAKILDWQSWRADTGTDDLAYMMACHWPVKHRAALERDLLARYHHNLTGWGMHPSLRDYTWKDCQYDYQASIIRCLSFLLAAWKPQMWQTSTWWGRVHAGLRAFDDWRCADIL